MLEQSSWNPLMAHPTDGGRERSPGPGIPKLVRMRVHVCNSIQQQYVRRAGFSSPSLVFRFAYCVLRIKTFCDWKRAAYTCLCLSPSHHISPTADD